MAYTNRDLVRDQELKLRVNTPQRVFTEKLAAGRPVLQVGYVIFAAALRKIENGEWDCRDLGIELEVPKA